MWSPTTGGRRALAGPRASTSAATLSRRHARLVRRDGHGVAVLRRWLSGQDISGWNVRRGLVMSLIPVPPSGTSSGASFPASPRGVWALIGRAASSRRGHPLPIHRDRLRLQARPRTAQPASAAACRRPGYCPRSHWSLAGTQLAAALGITVHRSTLLRLVIALPEPAVSTAPKALGVDDSRCAAATSTAPSWSTPAPGGRSTCWPAGRPARWRTGSRRTRARG